MDYRALTERMRRPTLRRTPLSVEAKKALRALMITLMLLFLGASGLFLYQTSKSAEQGFLLKQTQVENEKQKIENEDLKQRVLQAQSFKNISESKILKKMAQPEKPFYVSPGKVTYRISD